jgi:DNA polymerase-3 subunit delta'
MITFRDIPGRTNLKEKLAAEIKEGKPGHAYIFEGPEGCGKKDFAVAFAYMILCTAENDGRPCGKCRHCRTIEAGGSGELYVIEESKKSISIDTIRQLQDNINLLPTGSRSKAYIIAGGDRMTRQAQNCLLKTLEEPPGYAHIIITAANSDKFIDTIRSRAVTIQVGINSIEEIMDYLKERYSYNDADISIAAQCSAGSVGRAVEILETKDFSRQRELAVDFIKDILDKKYGTAYDIAEKLSKGDTDVFFATTSSILRDMAVYGNEGGEWLINIDKKDIILKGASRYSDNVLVRIAFIMEKASGSILENASKRQTLDAMIVKITEELAKW